MNNPLTGEVRRITNAYVVVRDFADREVAQAQTIARNAARLAKRTARNLRTATRCVVDDVFDAFTISASSCLAGIVRSGDAAQSVATDRSNVKNKHLTEARTASRCFQDTEPRLRPDGQSDMSAAETKAMFLNRHDAGIRVDPKQLRWARSG